MFIKVNPVSITRTGTPDEERDGSSPSSRLKFFRLPAEAGQAHEGGPPDSWWRCSKLLMEVLQTSDGGTPDGGSPSSWWRISRLPREVLVAPDEGFRNSKRRLSKPLKEVLNLLTKVLQGPNGGSPSSQWMFSKLPAEFLQAPKRDSPSS